MNISHGSKQVGYRFGMVVLAALAVATAAGAQSFPIGRPGPWPAGAPAAAAALPAPSILVNGQRDALNLSSATAVTLSVALEPGGYAGTPADWWVAAEAPSGWYSFQAATGSWEPGLAVAYQGGLAALGAMTIFQAPGLPDGTYRFYFGVDGRMNGALDDDVLVYDGVTLTLGQGLFSLTSDAGVEGGTLPIDYTYDGSGASPPLAWTHVPEGTTEFALLMTTLPGDGTTKWNWVLYHIPATLAGLAKNSTEGTRGMTSHAVLGYAPPSSQGPGAKLYTFTLYALSASPVLPGADQVTGDVLTQAISALTLGSAPLNLNYTRTAPVADFTYAAGPTMEVVFTDASGQSAASWSWNFGDGAASTDRNPRHTYSTAGSFTVSLTVANPFGSNTVSKTVAVSAPPARAADPMVGP